MSKTVKQLQTQYAYDKRTGYAAQNKYRREKCRTFRFTLSPVDVDMIDYLEAQQNLSAYLRTLIRADMGAPKER